LARIAALVTVSAPTELAVEIARVTNLTLIALARRDSFLTFNDPFNSIVK
jgi:formate dehydrogenase assembly factor FdhD